MTAGPPFRTSLRRYQSHITTPYEVHSWLTSIGSVDQYVHRRDTYYKILLSEFYDSLFFNAIAILHFDETRRAYIDIWIKWHVNIVDISSTSSDLSLHVRKKITAGHRWHSSVNPIQDRVGWRSGAKSSFHVVCNVSNCHNVGETRLGFRRYLTLTRSLILRERRDSQKWITRSSSIVITMTNFHSGCWVQ